MRKMVIAVVILMMILCSSAFALSYELPEWTLSSSDSLCEHSGFFYGFPEVERVYRTEVTACSNDAQFVDYVVVPYVDHDETWLVVWDCDGPWLQDGGRYRITSQEHLNDLLHLLKKPEYRWADD